MATAQAAPALTIANLKALARNPELRSAVKALAAMPNDEADRVHRHRWSWLGEG